VRTQKDLFTHPAIAPGQAHLTPEFFTIGLSEKNVYFDDMSILSILLSFELGCHMDVAMGLIWPSGS
jgi:hypothetical protein